MCKEWRRGELVNGIKVSVVKGTGIGIIEDALGQSNGYGIYNGKICHGDGLKKVLLA
jgi:hypothetical protein